MLARSLSVCDCIAISCTFSFILYLKNDGLFFSENHELSAKPAMSTLHYVVLFKLCSSSADISCGDFPIQLFSISCVAKNGIGARAVHLYRPTALCRLSTGTSKLILSFKYSIHVFVLVAISDLGMLFSSCILTGRQSETEMEVVFW